jgi:hypothetical protein
MTSRWQVIRFLHSAMNRSACAKCSRSLIGPGFPTLGGRSLRYLSVVIDAQFNVAQIAFLWPMSKCLAIGLAAAFCYKRLSRPFINSSRFEGKGRRVCDHPASSRPSLLQAAASGPSQAVSSASMNVAAARPIMPHPVSLRGKAAAFCASARAFWASTTAFWTSATAFWASSVSI